MVKRAYLERLLSHVPAHVARAALTDPARSGSWGEHLEASLLVADFSGFTSITEALEAHGRAGAMQLTDVLNRYFRMLLDEVAFQRGAVLTKFGGDGLTLLYALPGHARAAVASALEMQEAMALFPVVETLAGEFPLSLRIGVATGRVFHGVVGRRAPEYLLGGRTVEAAVAAQGACPRGAVTVTSASLAELRDTEATEIGAGLHVVHDLADRASRADARRFHELVPLLDRGAAELERFVNPAVVALLRASPNSPQLEPRYLPATALFVEMSGLPFDAGANPTPVLVKLGEALAAMLFSLGRPILKTDVSATGVRLVLLYGPPEGAPDHALTASVTAALVRRGLMPAGSGPDRPGPGPVLRMGLCTGEVYAGEVGSPVRREYTALGDAVNTAARLAARARPWEILASAQVARCAEAAVYAEPVGSLDLRGKQAAVDCVRIIDARI